MSFYNPEMPPTASNVDAAEIAKFERLADRWWNRDGEFKPLHDINPLRLEYIDRRARLSRKQVLDVGCGGGILAEGMAEMEATVTGIDLSEASLQAARLHLERSSLAIEYRAVAVEELAASRTESFDVVTCMEMLEHVPDPERTVAACGRLLKPGGHAFFSTINRNARSFLFAVVGAEYILRLLPRGTHEFAHFVRPAELGRWIRDAGLDLADVTGLIYNPLTRSYRLGPDVSINYLMHARKA
jgi:2-polyprenyl-6-hydroxyphenyl methylase/3-demethylubiquinone-9 3-methyltransferase